MEEIFPWRCEAANFCFNGVGENDESTSMKELRDIFLVVGQVVVKCRFQFDIGVFELDKDQRDTVDIQDDIRSSKTCQ